MKMMKQKRLSVQMSALYMVVLTLMCYPAATMAQGNTGNANGSQVGSEKTQDRGQDRERTQDPATHDGTEPDRDQDRTQDQDRIQDQTCVGGVDCEPDRDRLNSPANTSDQLRRIVREQERNILETEVGTGDQMQSQDQSQKQVRVATRVMASSSDLLGPIGPAVARIAQDFEETVQQTTQTEEQIHNRSRLNRFLFGGDDSEVTKLRSQLEQNQNRIQELNQLVQSWEGDPQVSLVLSEQIQHMEREQQRLQAVADQEETAKGLFNYLLFWRS